MVDISKHLARAKQALDRRNYDLALEITLDCQEVDPANLDNYRLLLDAAKRKLKESGKKGGGFNLGFSSKDPHKALTAAVRRVAKSPDPKSCALVGDAARQAYDAGQKKLVHVAVLFYEDVRSSGLFMQDALWNLGHMYYEQAKDNKDLPTISKAIEVLSELAQGQASHGEAARTLKGWEATKSMWSRAGGGGTGANYRNQVADDREARRNEVMGRQIRTVADAEEVLGFIDDDLQEHPEDKRLWVKKGDVLRRIKRYDAALAAFAKSHELDPHDFTITMRVGDTRMEEMREKVSAAKKAGQDVEALKRDFVALQMEEYAQRAERQPTEMSHRFNLAKLLFKMRDIDQAAGYFQQAKKDPRYKREALKYLGQCFASKNLLDIARDQFTECLSMIEDELSDEHKDVRYLRARNAEIAGDSEAAKADYRKIVELDLGYRDAADRLAQLK